MASLSFDVKTAAFLAWVEVGEDDRVRIFVEKS